VEASQLTGSEGDLIEKLTALNQIGETLNRAADVRNVLDLALGRLVEIMGLETGWIALRKPPSQWTPGESQFKLAAHHRLPPALEGGDGNPWAGICTCQRLCSEGLLTEAYNEVRCSRLAAASRDRRGLAVHASAPLRSGDDTLGILNVAAPDWSSFSPQALALLTNVGNQIGIALERARLYDLVQERRVNEQAVLLDLSNQLLSHPELADLIEHLVEQVHETLRVDACALLLRSDGEGPLRFRAAQGWRVDPAAAGRELPVDERSGPGWVMHTRQPLVAEDLSVHDPLPWAAAWLQAEGFRGHAAVPLLVEGRPIGVLTINQRQPRLLDPEEIRLLQLMANQAAVAIEKARLHEEEIKMQAMESELEVARQIQLSLLPNAAPVVPGWEFATFYEAAREVGGDFYDFLQFPGAPDRLGLVIADVTGKGVPAALFMAQTSTMIRVAARRSGGPAEALAEANVMITQDRHMSLLLTAFYATLDTRQGRLAYASAGHNRPLWLSAGTGLCQELKARGTLMGAFDHIELEEGVIDLGPGDVVVLYTDGVTEAMDVEHRQFGEERLVATVAACADAGAQQVVDAVVAAVRSFTGNIPQSDDLTVLVVKRCPPSSP